MEAAAEPFEVVREEEKTLWNRDQPQERRVAHHVPDADGIGSDNAGDRDRPQLRAAEGVAPGLPLAAAERIERVRADAEREEIDEDDRRDTIPVDRRREHRADEGEAEHHRGVRQEQQPDCEAQAFRADRGNEPFAAPVHGRDYDAAMRRASSARHSSTGMKPGCLAASRSAQDQSSASESRMSIGTRSGCCTYHGVSTKSSMRFASGSWK